MNFDQLRQLCLSLPYTHEHTPFDERTLVFYVGKKMFALTDMHEQKSVNLKCDPDRSILLRHQYSDIIGGYHMNKKHWNTIFLNADVPSPLLHELVLHSYSLVLASMTKKERSELQEISL